MRPLVSVIVPNYNHARFLRQRIESVVQQSYPNIEVLLLDDFSSDGSLEIIESYRNHPKVTHVILNDHNQGSPFIQWKKGLDLAKGELTWIAESDDYAEFTFVEQLVNIIGKDKGMGLAFCQSNTVDSAGHELNKTMEWWTHDLDEKVWRSDYIHTGEEEVRSYLIFKNTIPNTSGVVFRTDKGKALIDQILSYRYCGDWLFWALICLHSERIGYRALVLNHFRNSAASTRSLINYRKMSLRVNEIYSVMLILSEQLQVNAYRYYGYYFRIHFNLKDGNLNGKRNKYFWQLLLMDKLLFARLVNHYLIVIVKKIFKKKKKSLPVQMF